MRKLLATLTALLFLLPLFTAAGHLLLLNPPGPFESYQVRGVSMLPSIRDGDLILNRPVAPQDIRVGDIITFEHAHEQAPLITHRVIRIYLDPRDNTRIFIAQGDNADIEDRPISGDAIVGRLVFVVPSLGAAQQWISANLFLAALSISAVFVLFWGIAMLLLMKLRTNPCKDETNMIEYYI